MKLLWPKLATTAGLLAGLLLIMVFINKGESALDMAPTSTFAQQVVMLTNQERDLMGLPPLKLNLQLEQAAFEHSRNMAMNGFFDHTNPLTGSTSDSRATAAGYHWSYIAENIAQGYSTPSGVLTGWMESPLHRANLRSTDAREIGVGYFFNETDADLCGDSPCEHYWTQLFGADPEVFPLIINGEAISTTETEVGLYIYGQDWAAEMRLRNDDEPFTDWEPFISARAWTLPSDEGTHTVTAELRDDTIVRTASDDIVLFNGSIDHMTTGSPEPKVEPANVPLAAPDVVSVSKTPTPLELLAGQSADVVITLNGIASSECQGIPGKPLDVMLVYDISDSAGAGSGSNWEQTITFTLQLLDQLARPVYRQTTAPPEQSQLGIITSQTGTFGPEPRILQEMTSDYATLRTTITDIQPGGDTEIAAGIELAVDLLSEQPVDRAQAIILMLHDNKAIDQAAIEAVQRASAYIPIYIVSNSKNLLEVDRITSDLVVNLVMDDHFYSDPKPEDIRNLFIDATEGDQNAISHELQISDEFSPAASVELLNVSGPGGRVEGGRTIWNLESLQDADSLDLNYTVRVVANAAGAINRIGRGTYLDCNGYPQSLVLWQETIELNPSTLIVSPTLVPEIVPTSIPNLPAGSVKALCVPWYTIENEEIAAQVEFVSAPHDTWGGLEVTLKGVARAAEGSRLIYTWEFDDGSPSETGDVIDPYTISANHVYKDAPDGTVYDARLTITDVASGYSDTCIYKVAKRQRSLPVEVNVAIDQALWYLHTQTKRTENADDLLLGDWGDSASTSMAVLAFEVRGHQLSGDQDTDPYVETVQRGVSSLFEQLQVQELSSQPAGDPDANGNGIGLYIGPTQYQDGMILMALANSDAPEARAAIGVAEVKGQSYREVAQDIADFIAWAQTDSPDYFRGGWRYSANGNDADMSVSQWPGLGLMGIESADLWGQRSADWSVVVPDWVKIELRENFLRFIQDTDGGFGYVDPSSGKNLAKTGAGLALLAWTGVPADRPDALDDARSYITAHWNDADDSWGHPGNLGNFYAMYGIMKASRLKSIETYDGHDWYQEYADYLMQNQGEDGHWDDLGWASGELYLSTAWGVLILSPTVGVGEPPAPPPVLSVVPTPLAPPTTVSITISLCLGETSPPYMFEVNLPPTPVQADVLFIFDVTSSMGAVLNSAAVNADSIMDSLSQLLGDVQFGVVSLSDYPLDPYGAANDYPYRLHQAITSDQNKVKMALNALALEDGSDGPEAYTRAFYEAYSDPSIGWREGSRHFIVSFGDSIPHDDDLNIGIPAPQPFEPSDVWQTGLAPTYLDPGRDGIPGTADDLDFQIVIEELEEEGYTLLHVISGEGTGVAGADLLPYWTTWSKLTPGGQAILLEDVDNLPMVILDLVSEAAREIEELVLIADPGYEDWITADPPMYRNLDIPAGGFSPRFQVVFNMPVDLCADTYHFQIQALGDGTIYGAWSIQGTVPETCADKCDKKPCGKYCTEWYWKFLPFLFPLLVFLLWWFLRCKPECRENERDRQAMRKQQAKWTCWLFRLLALILTLIAAYFWGRWLASWLCYTISARAEPAPIVMVTPTPDPQAIAGVAVGRSGSQNVAAIIHGGLFDLSSERPEVAFTQIDVSDLVTATLAQYDTLLLSQVCNISQLPEPWLEAIRNWVGNGHKLIIYDSDECGRPVNYDWLAYCFTTSNPGAQGSNRGEFVVLSDDGMISADINSPVFVDQAEMSTFTEIGDANVMVTQDMHWCCDAEAENLLGQRGCVHAYAFYGRGLIVYNGLDTDSILVPSQNRLWQNELDQPWDSLEGKPIGLACRQRVVAPPLFPWIWLLPLLLWPLVWWFCCRRVKTLSMELPPLLPPPAARKIPEFPVFIGPPPEWDPAPTLVIGLGGAGRWVLTHLKKNLLDAGKGRWHTDPRPEKYGGGFWQQEVRLLLLDNAPVEKYRGHEIQVRAADVELEQDEQLVFAENLSDLCQGMVQGQRFEAELEAWFPAEEYVRLRSLRPEELDVGKSTGGRRPLGRAVVFRDIQKGVEDSRLWQKLSREVASVMDRDRARVVIVGSLCGGMGSAVLADVAYLVRMAAQEMSATERKAVVISGLLATDNAFAGYHVQPDQLRLNAEAALRELSRFLLAFSRPYPMVYLQESRSSVFNGYCKEGLFDDVYLFDGQRPKNALTRWKPEHALYPMMADLITSLMDRASQP
ncbi:MAG: VWA domain-containing protein, partial [Anaerolineales bacterium]|nr:VWA domain-containing protein [Anaerolineales bacterium]